MISIQKHSRGLLMSAVEGKIDNALVRRLEDYIGGDRLLSIRGGLVAPLDAAADVLDVCDEKGARWDEDLLRRAHEQAAHRSLQLAARIEVARALDDPYTALASYERLSRLDPHQVSAVAAMSAPSLKGLGLFDEQGSGKTIMVLAAFDWLRQLGTVERLLVVAPKSVLGSWRAECESFLDGKYGVILVDGSAAERRRAIQRPHDILLISYDGAWREQGLLKMVVAARANTYMLAVDESYFVKNAETARAQAIATIRPHCERAIVLCGTPAPNSAVDVVNQITIADGGVAFAGRTLPADPDAAEAAIAVALDKTIYLRRLKEDIFPDIPKKNIERVSMEFVGAQKVLYDRAHDELVVAVRSVDDRGFTRHLASFLARRMALLQICSNPRVLDPLYNEEPAKLLAMDRLLGELIERDGKKVVVWSYFQYSLQAIVDRYEHLGVVRIDGTVSDVEARMDAIRRFQADPGVRLFVGNAGAAGAGITLTAAHHAIYESFSNQAVHYMQSVDRIHRRGQQHDVTYHVLLAHDTIEEREFDRLLQKEHAGRQLLGDKYEEPMTRARFLEELSVAA